MRGKAAVIVSVGPLDRQLPPLQGCHSHCCLVPLGTGEGSSVTTALSSHLGFAALGIIHCISHWSWSCGIQLRQALQYSAMESPLANTAPVPRHALCLVFSKLNFNSTVVLSAWYSGQDKLNSFSTCLLPL